MSASVDAQVSSSSPRDAKRAPGTIVTFYSYKGGVGRTLALANVGALLAKWGFRVLCVDWDLEAPGLHLYFESFLASPPTKGLVELIEERGTKGWSWWNYLTTVRLPDSKQDLLLMPAGQLDASYNARMQELDWNALYAEDEFASFLEWLRAEWKSSFDFILIDSRTGVTDIGGICTIQLPDLLVALFTANRQSLSGVLDVALRADERRNALPFDRSRLQVLPIATRFEKRVEHERAGRWLNIFSTELKPLFDTWVHKAVSVPDLLNYIRIPSVPYWTFGESLPVIEEGTRDPEGLGYPLETMAALIAHRLDGTEFLMRARDEYVADARRLAPAAPGREGQPFRYDVFLSYQWSDRSFARDLAEQLHALRLEVFWDQELPMGSGVEAKLSEAVESSQHMVVIVGKETAHGRWPAVEYRAFLSSLSGPDGAPSNQAPRRLLPIVRKGVESAQVPSLLLNFAALRENGGTVAELAHRVAASLAPDRKLEFVDESRHGDVSTKLWRALLEHQRQHRTAAGGTTLLGIENSLISYSELYDKAGVAMNRRWVGVQLSEIHEDCVKRGWPPINALVVNQKTRRPGETYPGTNWHADVVRVLSFEYPSRL